MNIFARQGDLIVSKIDGATLSGSKKTNHVLAGGLSGHTHTIVGPSVVSVDGDVTKFTIAKATQIKHAGKHKPTKLPAGSYSATILRERGGQGDRQVVD